MNVNMQKGEKETAAAARNDEEGLNYSNEDQFVCALYSREGSVCDKRQRAEERT